MGQSASSPSLAPIRQRPADVSQLPAAAGGGDVREALRLQYAAILSIAEAVRARPPPAAALEPKRLGEDAVATHLRSEVAHLRYTVSRQNGELAWQQVETPIVPTLALALALTLALISTCTFSLTVTLARRRLRSYARR